MYLIQFSKEHHLNKLKEKKQRTLKKDSAPLKLWARQGPCPSWKAQSHAQLPVSAPDLATETDFETECRKNRDFWNLFEISNLPGYRSSSEIQSMVCGSTTPSHQPRVDSIICFDEFFTSCFPLNFLFYCVGSPQPARSFETPLQVCTQLPKVHPSRVSRAPEEPRWRIFLKKAMRFGILYWHCFCSLQPWRFIGIPRWHDGTAPNTASFVRLQPHFKRNPKKTVWLREQ